jgi:uncharacterized membrane protein YfcA
LPSVAANATSTVALLPGAVSGAWGFREELRASSVKTTWLVLPSIAGGAVGALLLTRLNPAYFSRVVPYLIALAAILLLLQPVVSRHLQKWMAGHPASGRSSSFLFALALLAQFAIGIYGGYFGAGISILLLSTLSFLPLANFHEANALKTVLNFAINCTAAILFVAAGQVAWNYAAGMAVLAMAGGYSGARLSRQVNPQWVRRAVTVFGLALSVYYFSR